MRTTWLVPVMLAVVAAIALADGSSGIPMWFRLRGDVAQAHRRVQGLVQETDALRAQIDSLQREPFALERAIREDLELAKPGEIVVRFDRPDGRER